LCSGPRKSLAPSDEAEASLMLQDLPRAVDLYGRAMKRTESERDRDSMYGQAVRIAARIFGAQGVNHLEALCGFKEVTSEHADDQSS
jgi:hypothetical protein